jgi:signal transduction histidine kinase
VRVLVRELLGRVRELSLDLRPAMLDDVGLFAALDWQCERFERQSRITITRNFDPLETRRFAPEIEIAAFRIAQEALTNVARHAKVAHAEVTVRADEEALHVSVRDSGAGFSTGALDPKKHPSNGLAGMRERARSASGDVSISSAQGQGTTIRAVFPLAVMSTVD